MGEPRRRQQLVAAARVGCSRCGGRLSPASAGQGLDSINTRTHHAHHHHRHHLEDNTHSLHAHHHCNREDDTRATRAHMRAHMCTHTRAQADVQPYTQTPKARAGPAALKKCSKTICPGGSPPSALVALTPARITQSTALTCSERASLQLSPAPPAAGGSGRSGSAGRTSWRPRGLHRSPRPAQPAACCSSSSGSSGGRTRR